ncbi:hypothetical protein [Amphibiibacter pelophylacis]|uniref:Uncharacterized protein n=1 Tax=Amphibiibacter pelophylacis TaxID=1799477 RepID=A0ACC6P449_9BURK
MIDIGTTDFYFVVPSLSKRRLEKYTLQLFDRWEQSVERSLLLPDYSLLLEVEEGSIKGKGRIAAGLAAVYVDVSGYGSFIQGLQIIRDQVNTVSDALAETAEKQIWPSRSAARTRKRGETLGSLQRLFFKVQRGDITPEEATREAELLIGEDAKDSPEFMSSLAESLAQAPKFHEQVPLPFESADDGHPGEQTERDRPPRRPSAPLWPLPTHLRVEVWRESKKQKKNHRTINV